MGKEEDEEVMMMMISATTTSTTSSENPTFPTWKLYQNPFYYSQPHHHHHKLKHQHHCQNAESSLWDLTIFNPVMESSSEFQILELKTKLEYERKARRKMESLNKRLAKEIAEERRARESLEKLCQELAREITSDRAEIDRMKREIEEERKMLRVAEVLREERVQMKLSDAKVFLEEKIQELETPKLKHMNQEEEEDDDFKGVFLFKIFPFAVCYMLILSLSWLKFYLVKLLDPNPDEGR